MGSLVRWLIFPLVMAADLPAAGVVAGPADNDAAFAKNVTPLLEKYCYECHGNGKHKGKLALDSFKSVTDVEQGRMTWEQVLHNVRSQEMPPMEDTDVLP